MAERKPAARPPSGAHLKPPPVERDRDQLLGDLYQLCTCAARAPICIYCDARGQIIELERVLNLVWPWKRRGGDEYDRSG